MYLSENPKIICSSYEGIFQAHASIQLSNLIEEEEEGKIHSCCLNRYGGQTYDEQTAHGERGHF